MKRLACFVICCLPACGATYYVANSGNDSNPGNSSGAPWKTLARVNSATFAPGDYILLNRGDIWREQLVPPSNGSSGSQITFSSYGTGAKPVVTGANLITQWTGSEPAPAPASCSGSCIFSSGMEKANFSDWSMVYLPATDGTSITQTNKLANSGSYSAKLTGTGYDNRAGLSETFSALGSEGMLYTRFYIYVPPGALKANDSFVLFQIPFRSSNVSLATDSSGNIKSLQFYSVGGSIVRPTNISFNMGAWNYLEAAYKIGSSDGGGQVWLNGLSIGSNYSLNTSSAIGLSNITVGNDSFGHGQVAGGSIYLDDLEIATSGPIGAIGTGGGSSNGIWTASVSTEPNVVFIAGNLGVQKYSASELIAPGEWSWSGGTLSVYSASGPPSNVEAAQRDYGLLLGQTGSGSYVTVTGIDFRIANADAVHIVNTSGDVVDNAAINGAYQFGLVALGVYGSAVNYLMISNNSVSMNGASGIEISSGHSNVTIQGNTVFGNAYNPTNTGVFTEIGGINLLSVPGQANHDLIQKNVSDNNGVYSGSESQGTGIWFDSIGSSTMQDNVSFKNAAFGVYFEKTNSCSLLNNVSYSNAFVPNSANIGAYASQGVSSSGNLVDHNTAWDSRNWGLKVGAYEGGGFTQVYNNTYSNNIVINSQSIDLYADNGADNDGSYGFGNKYSGNAFGSAANNWLYWNTYGFISNYAQLDAAYGAPANSVTSGWSQTIGGQERCTGSCIFSSGFETSGLSDFSAVYKPASDGTTVTQIGSAANSGEYSLRITGGGTDNRGGISESFPAVGSGGPLYFRFYVNIPAGALKASDQFQLFLLPASGANVSLGTDGNGNVNTLQFTSAGGAIIPLTPVSFPMSSWNYVDVAYSAGSGNGGGQVWINGTYVGGSYSQNTSPVNSVIIGNLSYGHGQAPGGNIYLDDFRIANVGPIGAAAVTLPVP